MLNARRFAGPLLLVAVMALVASSLSAQPTQMTTEATDAGQSTQEPGRARVTQAQVDNAAARIAAANAIVSRFESDAKASGRGAGWRQATFETLLPLSLEALRRVEQEAFSIDALSSAVHRAAEDPSLIGDPTRDLTYTPIVPCRYIDTRNVAGRLNGVRSDRPRQQWRRLWRDRRLRSYDDLRRGR